MGKIILFSVCEETLVGYFNEIHINLGCFNFFNIIVKVFSKNEKI